MGTFRSCLAREDGATPFTTTPARTAGCYSRYRVTAISPITTSLASADCKRLELLAGVQRQSQHRGRPAGHGAALAFELVHIQDADFTGFQQRNQRPLELINR